MNKRTWIIVLVVIVSLLAMTSSVALAQQGARGYIRVNNGNIVTSPGQSVQVVVQFGNRGRATLEDVYVSCLWDSYLGTPGAVYPGPFPFGMTYNDFDFEWIVDSAAFAIDYFTGNFQSIDIAPGQNYNVAFNINIDPNLPRRTTGTMICYLLILDQNGLFQPIDETREIRIRVR